VAWILHDAVDEQHSACGEVDDKPRQFPRVRIEGCKGRNNRLFTTPAHHFINEYHPAKPRMPGIKNFSFLGPVGVMLSSCTMTHPEQVTRILPSFDAEKARVAPHQSMQPCRCSKRIGLVIELGFLPIGHAVLPEPDVLRGLALLEEQ
jgi:hypothetical protein